VADSLTMIGVSRREPDRFTACNNQQKKTTNFDLDQYLETEGVELPQGMMKWGLFEELIRDRLKAL